MRALRFASVLISAVVAIAIPALETLTEVIVVVVPVDVVAVIAVVRVLIGIRASVVRAPTILVVCLSSAEAFLITVVHSLPEKVCAVLIGFVVAAATVVAIGRSGIEVRIAIVIGVIVVLEKYLLLTDSLQILFLKTVLRHALLLLQLHGLLL